MNASATLKTLHGIGVLPVLRAPSPDLAIATAEAVHGAGLPIAEVTLTVPNALAVIRALAQRHGTNVLLGAGSVLSVADARAAVEAGARFVVTPALDEGVIAFCLARDVVVASGALTPTEIVKAWRAGAHLVKVFPCGAVGGPSYVRAIKAPLPDIPLVPTGGVTVENAAHFFDAGAALIGMGSDLVDVAAVRAGDTTRMKARIAAMVALAREAKRS